jgi:hypothetical protein
MTAVITGVTGPPKSCSRCGARRRAEDNPKGELLIPCYWNGKYVCRLCAREMGSEFDRDGWPEDPLGELEWDPAELPPSTVVDSNKVGSNTRIVEELPIEKPRKVDCIGGPMNKSFLGCYGFIPMRVPWAGGSYEYDQGNYIWHPEVPR